MMTNDMAAAFGGAGDVGGHFERLLYCDSVRLLDAAAAAPVSPASSCGSSPSSYQDSLFDDDVGEGRLSSCSSSPGSVSVSIDCDERSRDSAHVSPRGKSGTFDLEGEERVEKRENEPPKRRKAGKTARFAEQVVTDVLLVIAIDVEEIPYTPEKDEFIVLSAEYEASTIPVWKTAVDKLLVRFADQNMEFPAADVYTIARELEEMQVMVGTSALALEMFAEQVWCQYWGQPCNLGDDSDDEGDDEEESEEEEEEEDSDEEAEEEEQESDEEEEEEDVGFDIVFEEPADASDDEEDQQAAEDEEFSDEDDEYDYSTADEGDDADFADSLPSYSHTLNADASAWCPLLEDRAERHSMPTRALAVLAWHMKTYHMDSVEEQSVDRLVAALQAYHGSAFRGKGEEESVDGEQRERDVNSRESTVVEVDVALGPGTKQKDDLHANTTIHNVVGESALQALVPEPESLCVAPAPTPKADGASLQGVSKPDPPADLHESKVHVDPHPLPYPHARTEDGHPSLNRVTIPVGQPVAAG